MWCRGVRGATTADSNTKEDIRAATRELLKEVMKVNGITANDVASAIFTTTPDLNAEFPAVAARELGWTEVALMCSHEMGVPGSLTKCIRVLLHVNTEKSAEEIVHVYIKGAKGLKAPVPLVE